MSECVMTGKGQARVAGEWVKCPGSQEVGGRGGAHHIVASLMGACVCLVVCTSGWSGATALGVHTSRCKQLWTPGSRV